MFPELISHRVYVKPWNCFPVNFAKFLRTAFFKEHLWWLLLCIKHCNFILVPGVETLRKSTVTTVFRTNFTKLGENCAFPQNFWTRKLGETLVFYVVVTYVDMDLRRLNSQHKNVNIHISQRLFPTGHHINCIVTIFVNPMD